jgi:hypothetical protein
MNTPKLLFLHLPFEVGLPFNWTLISAAICRWRYSYQLPAVISQRLEVVSAIAIGHLGFVFPFHLRWCRPSRCLGQRIHSSRSHNYKTNNCRLSYETPPRIKD